VKHQISIKSRGYRSKKGKLITCFLFIWSVWFTTLPTYASDLSSEVGAHTDTVRVGGQHGKSMMKDRRFVPVPVPISNPTLGTGLAVALLYLWPHKHDDTMSPTSISGVGGLYTSTDSWAAALFHQGYYVQDKLRLQGVLGYADLNLKFYGIGNDSIFQYNPLSYGAKGTIFNPQARFQLPFISKNLYLGLQLYSLDVEVAFELSNILPILPNIAIGQRNVGLGPILTYDSRDNTKWPSNGNWLDLAVLDFGDYAGGDFEYLHYKLKWEQNFSATDSLILQYRFDGQVIDGKAPFYQLSNINLRGIPWGVFADDVAVTLQGQVRWELFERWSMLFFGGGGRVAEDISDLGGSPTEFAGGTGFRYMIAPKTKLTIGADLAFSNGRAEFYIQVGDFLSN
jgi:hypothetical protein